ncbi:MAG: polyprenol monophosphomannose synthase [bacterium]
MKSIVIIPTYNELSNIQKLIPDLLDRYPEIHVLVVDDNSPDGTGDYVEKLAAGDTRIKIIRRQGKMGLGTAYVEGFKYTIENGYDVVIQMDADYSHDPEKIEEFLELIDNYDLIIGSRYVTGVNVINWPMSRLLLSYFANKYTQIVTGLPIKDCTAGFKCFKTNVLKSINLDKVRSNGYSFQIEMHFKVWKRGFNIHEIPIVFTDRFEGKSKMSKKIVREAIIMVWKLRIGYMFRKIFK